MELLSWAESPEMEGRSQQKWNPTFQNETETYVEEEDNWLGNTGQKIILVLQRTKQSTADKIVQKRQISAWHPVVY